MDKMIKRCTQKGAANDVMFDFTVYCRKTIKLTIQELVCHNADMVQLPFREK
jgi:hypothetical protein